VWGDVVLEADRSVAQIVQNIPVPGVLAGCLTRAGERDVFQIEAKKDERFTPTPLTREIGSPAVL